ncbi:putative protein OS=Tsukamurella paurometabola (strain ATCC 8368 / DSM / CCUG 35730 /CIP 100753 / JCM 10117 / KCTC 9821 / NBRC 16120 / NCIMB 702349/ NCTC 13040) OX=521096 GN=Tpau_0241 PE=4 SV=1 [Tsukamurella paurometabola]|uniref:Uncharacterized protein n=1 Tax=Tsukamurella paurometabola (strain ATCC 8368 / DSM 20162 / CCUG 35730 / CIP 100753 / JCM 10117 / KCTC 9821 / NBRC 16120 / NCIMB 702349 / NCTC 13040) TaxID=521096 RepID=D5UQQ8_TSUPD|nr:hypothetical protein Tpau_0241 [Tsukamurella paurometabola DSM 20162]SUP42100.1 Uncharacterised protein [Tsukamurella paurometabola]
MWRLVLSAAAEKKACQQAEESSAESASTPDFVVPHDAIPLFLLR